MSDDIDRLKTVLENLAQTNDELKDLHDAMRDTVNSVTSIVRDNDPEGHEALHDMSRDIHLAYTQTLDLLQSIGSLDWKLQVKARV